jgi:hypothetical protein
MALITLNSGEYVYFDSNYVSHLTDEDSGGFVVQYERLNLVDSNLINFVTIENYYIENSVEEEIIKVDYGEAAQKERWR